LRVPAGSEILGEAAAALSATYLALGGGEEFAEYLQAAEEVYAFGTGAAKGSYANATSAVVRQQQALTPSMVGNSASTTIVLVGHI